MVSIGSREPLDVEEGLDASDEDLSAVDLATGVVVLVQECLEHLLGAFGPAPREVDAMHLYQVIGQILEPVKPHGTVPLVASVPLFLVMPILVLDLIAARAESLVAKVTFEGLVTGVGPLVHPQIGQMVELHPADRLVLEPLAKQNPVQTQG